MRKVDELKGPSCLTNAADDEPLFVLRANDEDAPDTVREWAIKYRRRKRRSGEWSPLKQMKYDEAMRLADLMEEWKDALMKGVTP